MKHGRTRPRAARSSYPDLLGPHDWGQAGMRPADRSESLEFWACLGSLVLIAAAVVASVIV